MSPTDNGDMKSEMLSLRGELVVSVGDAVVMDVSSVPEMAEQARSKFATESRIYEVTYDSSVLGGVESVIVSRQEIDSYINILYMTQRSSNVEQWSKLPDPVADVYDCLVYTQYKIRSEDGLESYEKELEQLRKERRFKEEKPEWVQKAIK